MPSYKRKAEDIRRMRKISTAQRGTAQRGRYRCSGCWYDQRSGRYRQYWRPKRSAFYKKLCNRRVRRNPDISSGAQYKRISEFFWELY